MENTFVLLSFLYRTHRYFIFVLIFVYAQYSARPGSVIRKVSYIDRHQTNYCYFFVERSDGRTNDYFVISVQSVPSIAKLLFNLFYYLFLNICLHRNS